MVAEILQDKDYQNTAADMLCEMISKIQLANRQAIQLVYLLQ